jgi:hypothetical protein
VLCIWPPFVCRLFVIGVYCRKQFPRLVVFGDLFILITIIRPSNSTPSNPLSTFICYVVQQSFVLTPESIRCSYLALGHLAWQRIAFLLVHHTEERMKLLSELCRYSADYAVYRVSGSFMFDVLHVFFSPYNMLYHSEELMLIIQLITARKKWKFNCSC